MRFPIWPRPSTRAFIREARRLPGYSFLDCLHGYVYARWVYLYIGIGTGEHPLAKRAKPVIGWIDRLISRRAERRPAVIILMPDGAERSVGFADTYHGKVVTLAAATQLVTVKQDINLGDLEHIVPYAPAWDIVLQHPDHSWPWSARAVPRATSVPAHGRLPGRRRAVCRLRPRAPARPVALDQFGRGGRDLDRRARPRPRPPCVFQGRDARPVLRHLQLLLLLLRRAAARSGNGVPMLAASGYVSVQDPELCIGCGVCAELCQFAAISMADGRAFIDAAACMGCGVCVDQCDLGALTLVLDERKGIPLEINDLMRAALRV